MNVAEFGTCDLCGQDLIRTDDDCWHPHAVQRACPPEVYVLGIPTVTFGDGFGRPGREHFRAQGERAHGDGTAAQGSSAGDVGGQV